MSGHPNTESCAKTFKQKENFRVVVGKEQKLPYSRPKSHLLNFNLSRRNIGFWQYKAVIVGYFHSNNRNMKFEI